MIVPETSLSFAFRKQESFRDFATFSACFQRITIIETVDLRLINLQSRHRTEVLNVEC